MDILDDIQRYVQYAILFGGVVSVLILLPYLKVIIGITVKIAKAIPFILKTFFSLLPKLLSSPKILIIIGIIILVFLI